MNFQISLDNLISDVGRSLKIFSPEIVISITIVALLLVRLFNLDRWWKPYWVALTGVLIAFLFAFMQLWHLKGVTPDAGSFMETMFQSVSGDVGVFFGGMLKYDAFTVFFRLFLLLFLILVIALTVLSGIPDNEDGPDFYSLLLGATLGTMLMSSANHLLMLFLAVEMTSVPSYVMVGFLKGRKLSSEASLKYVVYGAGAAGVMLYGTSLIAGLLGTADFSQMAQRVSILFSSEGGATVSMADPSARTLVLGIMMVLVGLAFKLSIVPFHFWCPDAFEGASAEVAGFLSVASKAGAFALLVRFTIAILGDGNGPFNEIGMYFGVGLGFIAAVSATFGNLAAYTQTNIKRLLAYSTIAHAGYMLMAVASLLVIVNASDGTKFEKSVEANRCIEGLLYYLVVYLFMNLGAFAIVAIIRNEIFSEEIDDYKGLGSQCPLLCICMGICFFSLVGVPPFGGFFAKWIIFSSLFQAGSVHWAMWAFLCVAGLNTVFSLFYYMRVLNAMFFKARDEDARPVRLTIMSSPVLYIAMICLPILLFGMFNISMQGLSGTAHEVAASLFGN